jgi:5-methylcytosine-specific restriction endonuclease McrA
MAASHLGKSVSAETREKLLALHVGKQRSAKTRAKISAAVRGRKRRPLAAETRAKLSALFKGRPQPMAPVKGECVYCFSPATTRDHVIPRGRICQCGPRNNARHCSAPDNIVLACLPCNLEKAKRTPEEWFTSAAATI